MPTQSRDVTATFATPRAAKSTLGHLCDRGIDASRIQFTDETALRLRREACQTTGDRRLAEIAARAIAVGAAAGLIIGLLIGGAVLAVSDVEAVAALLPMAVLGLLLGGLLGGVYRWKENHAWSKLLSLPDLDEPMSVTARVRPADDAERELITGVLNERADEVVDGG